MVVDQVFTPAFGLGRFRASGLSRRQGHRQPHVAASDDSLKWPKQVDQGLRHLYRSPGSPLRTSRDSRIGSAPG